MTFEQPRGATLVPLQPYRLSLHWGAIGFDIPLRTSPFRRSNSSLVIAPESTSFFRSRIWLVRSSVFVIAIRWKGDARGDVQNEYQPSVRVPSEERDDGRDDVDRPNDQENEEKRSIHQPPQYCSLLSILDC